jgi:hypothetical protein
VFTKAAPFPPYAEAAHVAADRNDDDARRFGLAPLPCESLTRVTRLLSRFAPNELIVNGNIHRRMMGRAKIPGSP